MKSSSPTMDDQSDSEMNPLGLPTPPVKRWLTPVRRFLHLESASGFALVACTVVALVLANSPLAEQFASIWKTPVDFSIGRFSMTGDLGHLIVNDGLMAIFFFVIGLEIKREIVAGELSSFRNAILPIFAALGGMVVPAGVYLALQYGEPGQRGWAVPMATDIAFVVGILAIFGNRLPFALKILLLSLAIVDDLGAVLVIAFVYTDSLAWEWLGVAAAGLAFTYALNRIGVRTIAIYVLVGIAIWIAVFKSGVHPTVAGVLIGLLTPSIAWVGNKTLRAVVEDTWERLRGHDPDDEKRDADLDKLQFAARESVSPLQRLETTLHPWVGFFIMPVFALANAGVALELSGLSDPIAIAVALGLAVGKPVGIVFFCWLAIQFGLTSLPKDVTWPMLIGGSCLAGIGFTMALFINGLAFPPAEFPAAEAAGKIGTLLGSLVSVTVGSIILLAFVSRPRNGE